MGIFEREAGSIGIPCGAPRGATYLAPDELAQRDADGGHPETGAIGGPDLVADLHSGHPIARCSGCLGGAHGSLSPPSSHSLCRYADLRTRLRGIRPLASSSCSTASASLPAASASCA